jgi:hypothetical protein
MMTNYNLFAKSLVINFNTEFKREIGLKAPALLGLLILGTRVIREMLIACRSTTQCGNPGKGCRSPP